MAAKKTAKKTAGKKSTSKKTTAKRTATKRVAAKTAAARADAEKTANRALETGRTVYLAGLGFYGKLFDGAESQIKTMLKRVDAAREQAEDVFSELVKRGEKVQGPGAQVPD